MVTDDTASLQYSQSCYNVTAHCRMDNINCCAQTNDCPCSITFNATLEQLSVYSFCLIKHANKPLTHWIYHVQNFHVAQCWWTSEAKWILTVSDQKALPLISMTTLKLDFCYTANILHSYRAFNGVENSHIQMTLVQRYAALFHHNIHFCIVCQNIIL
jgi:hypothetical protein